MNIGLLKKKRIAESALRGFESLAKRHTKSACLGVMHEPKLPKKLQK